MYTKDGLQAGLAAWAERARKLQVLEEKTDNNMMNTCSSHVHSCVDLKSSHEDEHMVTISRFSEVEIPLRKEKEYWKQLEVTEWAKLVDWMKSIGFFAPKAVIKKYSAIRCQEAMKRTLHKSPRVPISYFTKVVQSLC